MNGLEVLVPITLFVVIAAVPILRGPLGKALAERLAGRAGRESASAPDAERVLAELDEVRGRLAEVEERLDFAERLLAKQRQAEQLGRGT